MPRQNIVTRASLNLAPISIPQRTRFYSRISLYLKHCIEMELQCKPSSIRWNREEGARVGAHELLNLSPLEIYSRDFTNDSKGRASKLYRVEFLFDRAFHSLGYYMVPALFLRVYRCSVDRLNCKLVHRKVSLSFYCDTRLLSVIYVTRNG